MFSAISLLVLACAITINAQGNPKCGEAKIGNLPTPHAVKFQSVFLPPTIRDWIISIPAVPECVYGVSGVNAIICDYDEVPTGYFTDLNTLKVFRTGELNGYGSVTITVYCIV